MPKVTLKLVFEAGNAVDGPSRTKEVSSDQLHNLERIQFGLFKAGYMSPEASLMYPQADADADTSADDGLPRDENGEIMCVWGL